MMWFVEEQVENPGGPFRLDQGQYGFERTGIERFPFRWVVSHNLLGQKIMSMASFRMLLDDTPASKKEKRMKSPTCHITYLGTATLLIEIGGLRLLTDPVFDPAGTDYHHGPIHLVKTDGPRVAPNLIGNIDAVLLSHDQHADNLDHSGREMLSLAKNVLTTPEGANRLQGNSIALPEWSEVVLNGPECDVRVTAMPAQHGPDGTQEATGPVTGFLLEWEGQTSGGLYISGDTVPFSGTREIARRGGIGAAILHLGCVKLAPMGDLAFSMSASEAAEFAQSLGAGAIFPVHFDGWAHFTEGREQASKIFLESPVRDRVVWLNPGERTSVLL